MSGRPSRGRGSAEPSRWLAAATLLALAGCRNPMRETVEAVVRQHATPRIVELGFADGSGIAPDTAIVVAYSESIDTASLVLGGTLGEQSDGGAWSRGTNPDDTLTISPVTTWPVGSGLTLTVEVADPEGYSAPAVDVTYGVLDGVVYVHASLGLDANPGTPDQPKEHFQDAVDTLERVYDAAEIRAAAGTYQVFEGILVQKDISILGGYSPDDWNIRDPATYETLISHSQEGVVATITYGIGVTADALLEGLTISGPSAESSALVYCSSSSPTIRNNTLEVGGSAIAKGISLDGGSSLIEGNLIDGGSGALAVIGLSIGGSSATIRSNTIRGDLCERFSAMQIDSSEVTIVCNRIFGPSTTYQNYGIAMVSSGGIIRNNIINPGIMVNDTGPDTCEGIVLQNSSPAIQNNIVSGGKASSHEAGQAWATGITLYSSSNPVIENNIIFAVGGDIRTGIWQIDAASNPERCNSNFFFGCPEGNYYYQPSNDGYLSAASVLETFLTGRGVEASGNVFATAAPAWDADYGYTDASPTSATQGGKDLSDQFSTDIDGVARTAPWSIGAYEKD